MKYMRKQVITILVSLLLFASIVPRIIFAAPYGEGDYGGGDYNVGEITPTPSNSGSGSSSSSSGSSGGGAPGCNLQAPDSVPDLFQINAKADSLMLFFTPSSGNRDRYYVSYGTKTGEYQYGFEFMNNENGVISVDIGALQKNTTYYFTVRAGNGCQPGEWSNELAARTGQGFPAYRWSSLPQVVTSGVTRTINPSTVSNIEIDSSEEVTPSPAQPRQQEPPPEATPQESAQPSPEPPTQGGGGIWQWLVNLFK